MDMRHINRRFRAERGQSLVEFALALPLLMLVILGMIDFGIAFNYNNDETSLGNQAIRFAVVNSCAPCNSGTPSAVSIEDYTKSNADSGNLRDGGSGLGIQTPGATITFCTSKPGYISGEPLAIGDPLTAHVGANYAFLPALVADRHSQRGRARCECDPARRSDRYVRNGIGGGRRRLHRTGPC